MLEIPNEEHMVGVKAFAEKVGLLEQFESKLEWLAKYGNDGKDTKVVLRPDIGGGLSFTFSAYGRDPRTGFIDKFRFCGGLIYHGPSDGFGSGAAPSFAVTLEPTNGWEIHT